MKKYFYFSAIALAGLLSACDDNYVDKFDIDYTTTDVKSMDYTLTASDYSTIASNATNQEIALAKDPETQKYVTALNAVKTNRYFTDDAPADEYIPALLAAKYPNADTGSKFNVTYNTYVAPSAYLGDLTNISSYTLTSDDYNNVWGSKVEAFFLSPQSVSKIPAILAEANPDAVSGDLMVVNYAYSSTEPSIGGGQSEDESTWTQLSPLARATGTNWYYVNVGPIDLSEYKGQTVNIGFTYASTTEANAKWELQNFRAASVPYVNLLLFAQQEDGSFKKLTRNADFKGAGNYVIAALWSDGNYYPFGRIASDKSYGYCTPDPISVSDGVISAADATDFVVTLEAGASDDAYYIKNAINKYFYNSYNSKNSSYYNSFNVSDAPGDTGYEWTVTNVNNNNDQFIITNTTSTFPITCTVYSGTVEIGTWADSKIEGYDYLKESLISSEGGFTPECSDWSNSNYGWVAQHNTKEEHECMLISPAFEIAESAVAPYFTVDEAFRYAGNAAEELTFWISTDYSGASTRSAIATRAGSDIVPNTAVLYTYNGTTWTEYTNSDANVSVFNDYDALGSNTISAPDYVLPNYLAKQYPYAEEGTKAVVIYNGTKGMTATELTYTAAGWVTTPLYTTETATFSKFADGTINAKMSVYIDDSFKGTTGGFTAQNVNLGGSLSYVWSNSSTYGWKASAYASKANNPSDSWLVSPAMNLKKAEHPLMSFWHVHQYVTSGDPTQYLSVLVSSDYKDDVEKATWTDITSQLTAWGSGSDWTYVCAGPIDLSAFIGNKIVVAFRYTSDSASAATWEIKGFKAAESSEFTESDYTTEP